MKEFSSTSEHLASFATSSLQGLCCPSCGSEGMTIFHEVKSVPVHSVLNMATCEQAENYPKGDISLGFCQSCGFISNVAFNPDLLEYSTDCEESQGFSSTFSEFARRVATQLVEKYALYDKDIIEIGCGKGDFLTLLCELGDNRGFGFDPAYVPGRFHHLEKQPITFIQDYYSDKYADYHGDLICCQMTLEHIYDTADFVNTIKGSIGNRTEPIVFFQVPNVIRILQDVAFEDIYYEHCSYFSPGSLSRLFRKCGFDILDLRTEYNGQYLQLEAKPVSGNLQSMPHALEEDIETLREDVNGFQKNYQNMVDYWHTQLQYFKAQAKRIVVWGSGSKGVAFLTKLKIYDDIEYVVDINPYRQGTYMPGTGQIIVAPDFLQGYQPDVVIVMNPIYCEEIQQELSRIGLHPDILALGEPKLNVQ